MMPSRRGIIFSTVISLILLAAGASALIFGGPRVPSPGMEGFNEGNMRIESPSFAQNGAIPAAHTCDGGDISPPLAISGVPEGAASLALIVDDPDAPIGTWTHWTVWNIPADSASIAEGSVPRGAVEGTTSFGKTGYGGPCPPSGTHRYFFKLYALDAALSLPPSADAAALEAAMEGHVIDKAGLVGTYARE
jgi:Raf kinase inhibitor-like YbhB/YbcL family protein